MRRINFQNLRFTTLLAVTSLTLNPLTANPSVWKVQKESTQANHIYSVDPEEKTLVPPSVIKSRESDSFEDPYLKHEIDWDSLDATSLDRVFDCSSVPVKTPIKKILPANTMEARSKNSLKKPSLDLLESLITEAEEHELKQSAEEILKASTGPKTFVSKGKIARMNNENLLAQIEEGNNTPPREEPILINFNNISIIEYIRFISRVSNKNFIFSEEDLQFTVTIVSEELTTLENVLMALFQELRVRGLSIIEEGNTFLIHKTDNVRAPGQVVSDAFPAQGRERADIITRVFRLNIADAQAVSGMIRPMLSDKSILEVLPDTNHIVVTDIASNIEKVMQLIKSVDAPNSSMVVGQYVVRNANIEDLIQNAEQIMNSIGRGQPITFVAHSTSNSIFIIAAPFLVEIAIPVLQRLDQNDGTTGIYDLNELRYIPPSAQQELEEILRRRGTGIEGERGRISPSGTQIYQAPTASGLWKLDPNGNWIYEPTPKEGEGQEQAPQVENATKPPAGFWKQDYQNHWEFVQGATPSDFRGQQLIRSTDGSWEYLQNDGKVPEGKWEFASDGKWRFLLKPGASIFAGKKIRSSQIEPSLPLGDIERTKFYIHKLQYRKGDAIQIALQQIGSSLGNTLAVNQDLIQAIQSTQWIEPSNSLIITGTPAAILKVKELIDEIDRPLRQVFIEMLIINLTIDDSLDLGVTWGSRFGGGSTAGAQAFLAGATPVPGLLASAGLNSVPDATPALGFAGYNLGIVGRRLSANGTEFASLAAFVKALHEKATINVVLSPKILTEDNLTAELFVGENTPFKTQSIANDQGSTITSNFEFKDVGTTLKVTPYLGNSNIVTLEIEFEQSSVQAGTGQGNGLADQPIGPTTTINRTKTRIHMPDGYFLVLSGLIRNDTTRERRHVPCLGGAPIIGSAFTAKSYRDQKRNLMLFIRPQIIDTEMQMDNLTAHQQNIFRVKTRTKRMWKLDYEETLDWLNAVQTDDNNNERECCQENDIWPHHRQHEHQGQHPRHKRFCE